MEGYGEKHSEFVRAQERKRSVTEFKEVLEGAKDLGDAKEWASEQEAFAQGHLNKTKETIRKAIESS